MTLLPALSLALLCGLAIGADATAKPSAAPSAAEDDANERVLVQMKIERKGGKTLAHPGHMMQTGEDVILVLTVGEHEHEVEIHLDKAGKGYKAELRYTTDGKEVLTGTATGAAKAWVKVKSKDGKTSVALRVDPSAKRPDEIDIPGGNDPLDGL